jgi:hypothetical protein
VNDLPAPLTLRLYRGGEVLFESTGRWLHPLFELQDLVRAGRVDPAGTRLVDRVTGLAAAFLVARLGIRELHTQLLSRRALPVLERHGIRHSCQETVDRIACATEQLLTDTLDLDTACALLEARRARALPVA